MANNSSRKVGVNFRKQAEEILRVNRTEVRDLTLPDTERLVHELEVHQLELEMQNEELRRAQQTIEASRDRYADLYDSAPVGYFTLNSEGMILEANLTAVTMMGVERSKLIKQSLTKYLFAEDQDAYYFFRKKLLETGEPQRCEVRLMKADATTFYAVLDGSAAPDDTGKITQYRLAASDITWRKQVEEELRRYRQDLEELVKDRTKQLQKANEQLIALGNAKDIFVSNVSHELRTPITSMRLHHELLRRYPERLSRYLDVMDREARRLTRTVEALLQLSRIDQHEAQITITLIDLPRLISHYVNDRIEVAEQMGLHLAFRESPKLPEVAVDVGMIEQALGVLLNNAMNYTPAGGNITVWTFSRSVQGRRWIGFTVADTGLGIDPEEQTKLFERFFRGNAARKIWVSGTGLGLALAKEIVTQHGGRVEVESSGVEGEGARFTVWLPVTQLRELQREDTP